MASITSWTRLEPDSRDVEFEQGLQARFYDPLWALSRQWQMGEFEGEDNGSPVAVRMRANLMMLDQLRLGASPDTRAVDYDPTRDPLEVIVEREPVLRGTRDEPNLHHRFESGQHFLRLLQAEGVGEYRSDYIDRYALAAPADDGSGEGQAFLNLYRSRVPDGPDLYADLRRAFPTASAVDGQLPARPRIKAPDKASVTAAVMRWIGWYEALYNEPVTEDSAWIDQRLEYTFAVGGTAASGQIALDAPEYAGGHLDWYAFDHQADGAVGSERDSGPAVVQTTIPTPVTYRSMPAARWWEFEDAKVNLGRVDAGADDVLRMLMIDFALRFSNDWFVIPFEQPIGSTCSISSLVVIDCFGGESLIEHHGQADGDESDWRMFTVAQTPDDDGKVGLFLAPALAQSDSGEPIEALQFLRDEMANMAWAVEQTVQGTSGLPRHRDEETSRARDDSDTEGPTGDEAILQYRLATAPPIHWTPLLPVRTAGSDPGVVLRRGRVLDGEAGELRIPEPLGRVLRPGEPLDLFEEEVPRSGVSVVRHAQRARWADGSTHTWIGRRKRNSGGPGASGLRFDWLSRPDDKDSDD